MAAISKDRLREQLEASMEDVAMVMTDLRTVEERLRDIRSACAEVWKMAELGDVPEWELQIRPRKVS